MRFLTAGESHGRGLLVILEGIPAGLPLGEDAINEQFARRQRGYGRGGRMQIEQDRVEIFAGVMGGLTIGAPIGMLIANKDWRKSEPPLTQPLLHRAIENSDSVRENYLEHLRLLGGITVDEAAQIAEKRRALNLWAERLGGIINSKPVSRIEPLAKARRHVR